MTQNPTIWYICLEKTGIQKTHAPLPHSAIHNTGYGSNAVPINRRKDKEYVSHIHNGILLNHKKNEIGSFVETWVDPESAIQSELSHK